MSYLRNEKNRTNKMYWNYIEKVSPTLWNYIYQKYKGNIETKQFTITTLKHIMHIFILQKELVPKQSIEPNPQHNKEKTKSIETKSTVSKPVVSKPVLSKPVLSKPVLSKPVVSKSTILATTKTDTIISTPVKEKIVKPKFTGKTSNTTNSNFKEWCKHIKKKHNFSREEFKNLKTEYKFSETVYDKYCAWYNYIKDNMII